jgi:hypothetical protein
MRTVNSSSTATGTVPTTGGQLLIKGTLPHHKDCVDNTVKFTQLELKGILS